MVTACDTIPGMAKHMKGSGGQRPAPKGNRKPAYLIYVRINPRLGAAFDELLARTRRTTTAEIEVILEKALESEGLWPPS